MSSLGCSFTPIVCRFYMFGEVKYKTFCWVEFVCDWIGLASHIVISELIHLRRMGIFDGMSKNVEKKHTEQF